MDMNDDELRLALSRYMDVVPPVTESTRATLVAKLKKCVANGSEAVHEAPVHAQENAIENHMNGSLEKEESRPIQDGRESPKYVTTVQDKSSPTKEFPSSFMNGLPAQKQSSPVIEYVSRLPSYRRRSIHPDRPGIDNPYSDVNWLSGVSPSPIKSRVEPFHKHSSFQSSKACVHSNILKSVLYVTIGLISVFFESFYSFFSTLTNALYMHRPSFKTCLCFVLVGLILIGLTRVLFGDPFYHNPVEDLRNFIKYSLTQ
uniref:LEM domain-containing protein n=1 Tax=Trichobilharzia regenti TaxID=157069 RepID=A0AA85KBH9_TRIRE|nr:unnamed protein product [Trichobilharzia regenti]